MGVESLINDRNMEQNQYSFVGNYKGNIIFGKDNYRLLVNKVSSMPGYYKVVGSYTTRDYKVRQDLHDPLQLDLFKNTPPSDLDTLINTYAW